MRIFIILFSTLILILSVRGVQGNPSVDDLNTDKWQVNGPFELSPERGRFALTYSIAENNSIILTLPLAKFATPDVGYVNNNYVSIFDPGVSFLTLPGYLLGKVFNNAQVGSFLIISVFAILNVLLIYNIAIKLKATKIMATIASFTFIFGTPAFAYSVTLYQHHISTFLILYSIYLILNWKKIWSILWIWFLFAFAITVDYPNALIMLPIVIYAFFKVFSFQKIRQNFKLKIYIQYILPILIAVIPIGFLLVFNQLSYNNPFTISGMIPRATEIDTPKRLEGTTQLIDIESEKTIFNFFETRNLLNGLYILFLSPDRGVVNYAPAIIIGFLGLFLFPIKRSLLLVVAGIIFINIVLYGMWGDVWGGWAFGSRYLIPSYAILAIFIGIALTHIRKYKILILMVFFILFSYSAFINTAGALTTNSIPPQIEVLNLERLTGEQQKYNYYRNFDQLTLNRSKSFIFNTYLSNRLSAWQYLGIVFGLIETSMISLIIYFFIKNKNERVGI